MIDRFCKGFKAGWHPEESLPAVVYYSIEENSLTIVPLGVFSLDVKDCH